MSNNAGVTPAGFEMGRAQLLQAQAARVTPDVRMNPVLIKPEGDTRSQVVVLGQADLALSKLPWLERKAHLWRHVRTSLRSLMDEHELVVLEGAGSPAEVNLKSSDIVNMRVAREVGARVLLAVDIDRGGAFAHLLGTWHCLDEKERSLLSGFVLNKFRGDAALLGDGLCWLEGRTNVPTLGVVPHLKLPLPEEDGFSLEPSYETAAAQTTLAIVRTPAMSNFDEFDALSYEPHVSVRWAEHPEDLFGAAAVILPGSKHVAADLAWLRRRGLASAIQRAAKEGVLVWGVCGGLQMLGSELCDPHHVEGGGAVRGLELLDLTTELAPKKVTQRVSVQATWSVTASGYEIHHGITLANAPTTTFLDKDLGYQKGNVYGVYVHGLFDSAPFRQEFLQRIGVVSTGLEWHNEVDAALDLLAAHLEAHLDMQRIDKDVFG